LADGVSIEMNAQSSVAIHSMPGLAGQIDLVAGEAAITTGLNVPLPLVVVAGEGRTIARQASFDIRHVGGAVCVTCLDGELRVEQGGGATSLQSREQLFYSSRGLSSVRTIDRSVVAAWRDGFLVFHATPLVEAIEEVNRYRPGKIILTNDELGRRLFNARFHIENVDEVVSQIQQVFGARVTSLPGGIVLLS
jgi:transmembrane sensor